MDTAAFEQQLASASAQGQALAELLSRQADQTRDQVLAALEAVSSASDGLGGQMDALCARLTSDWAGVAEAIASAAEAAGGVSFPAGKGVQGYAAGLDYVPWDGFPAVLHEGEAVLTARQADSWRGGSGNGGDAQALAQAVREALEGVSVMLDGESVGRLVAAPVGEALSRSMKNRRYGG